METTYLSEKDSCWSSPRHCYGKQRYGRYIKFDDLCFFLFPDFVPDSCSRRGVQNDEENHCCSFVFDYLQATASVDFGTEARIQQVLKQEFAASSMFCIAHR